MALNVACPPLALISIYGEVTGFHQFHDLQKPAKAEDTQLSVPVKDGSDPLNVACPPLIPIYGEVTLNFKKTTSYQSKDQGFNIQKTKSKDTIKMEEPIAQGTRCRFKIQPYYKSQDRTRSSLTKRIHK